MDPLGRGLDHQGGRGDRRWATTTATQVLEHVNKDAVKFQSNDRIVGDEVLPDIDGVLLVRKPPTPAF